MSGIMDVLIVAGMFALRIGVPVAALLVIGTLIDRAYRRREAEDTERPIAVEMPQSVHEKQMESVERVEDESSRN